MYAANESRARQRTAAWEEREIVTQAARLWRCRWRRSDHCGWACAVLCSLPIEKRATAFAEGACSTSLGDGSWGLRLFCGQNRFQDIMNGCTSAMVVLFRHVGLSESCLVSWASSLR